MKLAALLLSILASGLAHADLDAPTAKRLIEARQAKIGKKVTANVLSIDVMAQKKGRTLYRVNADVGGGEQTYQIRYPIRSKDGVTDTLLTTSVYSQPAVAKEVRLTESELATFVQLASDATARVVAKEFPDMKRTGIYTFANGERFKEPKAVILIVQVMYQGMSVPLLRKVYVERASKRVTVGYDD